MQRAILIFLAVFFIGLVAAIAQADPVNLQWDPVAPTPTGYRIYARSGATYDYTAPAWEGTATSCTLDLPAGVEYAFVARAYVVGALTGEVKESIDSNEVTNLSKPPAPKNLIARLLTAVLNWFKGLFA